MRLVSYRVIFGTCGVPAGFLAGMVLTGIAFRFTGSGNLTAMAVLTLLVGLHGAVAAAYFASRFGRRLDDVATGKLGPDEPPPFPSDAPPKPEFDQLTEG